MSVVEKDTIQIIAQSVGISSLREDVAAALAPDVEYRMREIMQEAIKCMRHSKRSTLTTDDVNSALSLRNVEPLYGFASGDPLRFRRALGHGDLFYVEDRDLDFKEVMDATLPKAPLDAHVVAHWLAVEGVQPAIPENAPIEALPVLNEAKKTDNQTGARKDEDSLIDVKPPVKHVLSRELQVYFERITEIIVNGTNPSLSRNALVSLSTDSGLHPLVPYFTQFIADEVMRSLDNFNLLFSLMRVVQSLLLNPHIHIEPYLHQLMPSVMTCLVARRIGGKGPENHWELRDFTAGVVAFICRRFGQAYHNLQERVARTLVLAFLDPKRSMTQHYGAISGLSALGSRVVQLLVLPNLPPYLQLLEPEMGLETQSNEMKRYEAWRVYGILQFAAGRWLYKTLKSHLYFLPSAAHRTVVPRIPKFVFTFQESEASTADVLMLTSSPSQKRTAAGTELTTQPAQKKPSQDIEMDMSSLTSTVTDGKSRLAGRSGEQGIDADDQKDRGKGGPLNQKANPLREAWKEDADVGASLVSLVDMFGEGMLPYIPMRELSLHI